MKALLYKDCIVAKKYLRIIFLIDALFIAVSILSKQVPFLSVFPLAMCPAVVTSLISYDERARFDRQCDAMPVSRRMQVLEKYLIGFGLVIVLGLLSAIGILRHYTGTGRWGTLTMLPALGLIPTSLMLPMIFRLGSEKGRVYYYLFYFGGIVAATLGADTAAEGMFRPTAGVFWAVLKFSVMLYAASMLISVRFYERREL